MIARRHRQTAILTGFTFAFVAAYFIIHGTNIVSNTYLLAAERFWSGKSPYAFPEGVTDWFKYSPFFAFCFLPFTWLPRLMAAELWALLNVFVYWKGVERWFTFSKKTKVWTWLALIGCAMEMDGAVRYQQVNALLIGITLIGLADFREGKFFRAGLWLAVATNLKVIPGLFVFGLLFSSRADFIKGLVAGAVLTFAIPALIVGPVTVFGWHLEWAHLLLKDIHSPGILDVETVLRNLGFSTGVTLLRQGILAVSVLGLVLPFFRRGAFPWGPWIALGTTCLLLVSPRTESPTFVIAGPAYLFLEEALENRPTLEKALGRGLFLLGFFFMTYSFNDLWPKALWNPYDLHWMTKTGGAFLLWVLALKGTFRRSHRV